MKPQSNYHESNIIVDHRAHTFKLMMDDQNLNITVENQLKKSYFHNSYSHSEISSITSEAGFPSNMAQLYEMFIACTVSSRTRQRVEINLDLNVKINSIIEDNKETNIPFLVETNMVLELISTFDGKLKRTYKYVFELSNVKANINEVAQLEKLSDRVSKLETLSDRVEKLLESSQERNFSTLSDRVSQLETLLNRVEKLLETSQERNLVDTNIHLAKEKLSGDEDQIYCRQEILAFAKNGFMWNCENGHLPVAKYIYSLYEYPFVNVNILVLTETAFQLACRNGHLDVAKWIYSLGNVDIYAADEYAFKYAKQNVLQWLNTLSSKN